MRFFLRHERIFLLLWLPLDPCVHLLSQSLAKTMAWFT